MTARDFSLMIVSEKESLNTYAHYLTNNYNDAQDLTQDTILRALVKRDKFNMGTSPRAWLCTIMKNTFVNNYRKNKRIVVADTSSAVAPLWHSNNSISHDTFSRLRVKETARGIDKLSDDHRMPLELYFNGYRYHEISKILDQPIGTVKSRIHLAKKTLSKVLEN